MKKLRGLEGYFKRLSGKVEAKKAFKAGQVIATCIDGVDAYASIELITTIERFSELKPRGWFQLRGCAAWKAPRVYFQQVNSLEIDSNKN